MPLNRTGLQTIDLPLRPAVCASAALVGKKEGEGPLADELQGRHGGASGLEDGGRGGAAGAHVRPRNVRR